MKKFSIKKANIIKAVIVLIIAIFLQFIVNPGSYNTIFGKEIPESLHKPFKLGLDLEGNIKYIIEYPVANFANLTSVIQHEDKLYLGSLTESAIGVIQLPDLTNINFFYENNPNVLSLFQNYPNPFNSTTNIEFSIPKTAFTTLKINTILGQEVATIVSERLEAGNHNYSWDASGFSSGFYIYTLETSEGFKQSKKLLLLK